MRIIWRFILTSFWSGKLPPFMWLKSNQLSGLYCKYFHSLGPSPPPSACCSPWTPIVPKDEGLYPCLHLAAPSAALSRTFYFSQLKPYTHWASSLLSLLSGPADHHSFCFYKFDYFRCLVYLSYTEFLFLQLAYFPPQNVLYVPSCDIDFWGQIAFQHDTVH